MGEERGPGEVEGTGDAPGEGEVDGTGDAPGEGEPDGTGDAPGEGEELLGKMGRDEGTGPGVKVELSTHLGVAEATQHWDDGLLQKSSDKWQDPS